MVCPPMVVWHPVSAALQIRASVSVRKTPGREESVFTLSHLVVRGPVTAVLLMGFQRGTFIPVYHRPERPDNFAESE